VDEGNPLFGASLKTIRARELYDQLRERVELFLERKPNEIISERDPDRAGEWSHSIRVREWPDPYFGVIIGDILHNARSALEYLVYELAIFDSGPSFFDPDPVTGWVKRTQFPIFDSEPEFKSKGIPMLVGLNSSHQAMIERLQPYYGVKAGPRHPLVALRDLSNVDKHRVVHAIVALVNRISPGKVITTEDRVMVEVLRFVEGPVVDGAEVVRTRTLASHADATVDVKLNLTLEVTVNGVWPLRSTMLGLVGFVEHEALPRFVSEF
jgi:hypothetical protein